MIKTREYRINIFEQLNAFYSKVFSGEHKFTAHHISLYVFIINQNNRNNWPEWIKAPIDLVMLGAMIGSKKTYYKCLTDLKEWGLIDFEKGQNEWKAPRIKVIKLAKGGHSIIPLGESSGISSGASSGMNSGTSSGASSGTNLTTLPIPLPTTLPTYLTTSLQYRDILTDNLVTIITENPDLFFTKRIKVDFSVSYSNGPEWRHVQDLKNINDLLKIFKADEQWIIDAGKYLSKTPGEIMSLLDEFYQHLKTDMDLAKTIKEFARHFKAWVRKVPIESQVETGKLPYVFGPK